MKLSIETINLIKLSLEEDIGSGDITTNSLITENHTAKAFVTAKEPMVLAGLDVFKSVFYRLSTNIKFDCFFKDGDKIGNKDNILTIKGNTRSLLTGERTALNFLQRLSGIATTTSDYIKSVEKDYKVKLIDTRKTTPGYRELEKYAVICGGGKNHRFGLYDMVMIKDNHIKAGNGITNCVSKIKKEIEDKIKIEVEVQNLKELEEALNCEVDIIMLDNMSPNDMKKAVNITNKRVLLEASGGVTIANLTDIAKTGVDLISIGTLTHSARCVDISMNVIF